MSSEQVRFAEAVASLTARLAQWGVEEPDSKAEKFMRDMTRNGWRPSAPATVHPIKPAVTTPATEEFHAEMQKLRARRKCAHGVKPEHCADHDEEALARAAARASTEAVGAAGSEEA